MDNPSFYLGRWVTDSDQPAEPTYYKPADLTTHAVMVGMTGSGKTGLMVAMLEEAACKGIPAIIIDPKGDLTNLLLHFSELRPADFEPWVDGEDARRKNITVAQLAEQTAQRWTKGLSDWGLGKSQIETLAQSVDYQLFTPGSTAGTPVNLLSSFAAPELDWTENREVLRERIASTVTALLGLVGMNEIDPLRSREHILLSNLMENAWSQGHSLDLNELILQVQEPPIERLGAFPMDRFFPEKDRFSLALLLNNFLAAPSFQTWLEGQTLDGAQLLAAPNGKPRFSIFYLAHLGESERMFFVTLLLASLETWMRAQRGSSGLRAILAFDEILGYMPPVANPPSAPVLLRLIKQARAFGLGLVLATQNPVDLNYKALSNAGTWMIGRLQTEQDKQRLLDGLQSLDGGVDRTAFNALMASVTPRVFLLHNIHQGGPRLFTSRWVMNYLAGPLTRAQLPALRPLLSAPAAVGSAPAAPAYAQAAPAAASFGAAPASGASSSAAPSPASVVPGSTSRPVVPNGITEYTMPAEFSLQKALAALGGSFAGPLKQVGMLYRPALLAQAETSYMVRKYNISFTQRSTCLCLSAASLNWDACPHAPIEASHLSSLPPLPDARYAPLPSEWDNVRAMTALQKNFVDSVYRSGVVSLRVNPILKVYAAPDLPDDAFQRQLREAVQVGLQAETRKINAAYDTKLAALKLRLQRQEDTIDRRKDEVGDRKTEQTGADINLITSIFGKRKPSISGSLTKRRLTKTAENNLRAAENARAELQAEWDRLQVACNSELQAAAASWQARAQQVTQEVISPFRKDIFVELFGIVWLPYYLVQAPDQLIEAPAFPL